MTGPDPRLSIDEYAKRHGQVLDGEIPALVFEAAHALRPADTLLDVGCGDGPLLDAMIRGGILAEGVRVRGIDASSERIGLLRAAHPEVDARTDDAEVLATVEDASIDLLVSSQVIEHVDDRKMIAQIARVLKPNGAAYLSTVWKRRWARYIYRSPSGWALDPTHLREYTEDRDLLDPATRSGLRLVRSEKQPIAYPIVDPILKRVIRGRRISQAWTKARSLRVPIPGYFLWELVLRKSEDAST